MYHNFRELSGRFTEGDIVRALVMSDNQLDKATMILTQPSLSSSQHQQIITASSIPIDHELKVDDAYFADDADADDEDDDDLRLQSLGVGGGGNESSKRLHGQNGGQNVKGKPQSKLKVNLTFESEKGVEINLINDVLSSSAMPFVGIKLYAMHFVWTRDGPRTKGTFSFDIRSSYYNPMIVTMEPLLEQSRINVNWNSMPSSITGGAPSKSLYTIKVHLQGVRVERSALAPKVIPVNFNVTQVLTENVLNFKHFVRC